MFMTTHARASQSVILSQLAFAICCVNYGSRLFHLFLPFQEYRGYLWVKIAHRFLLENSQNLRGSYRDRLGSHPIISYAPSQDPLPWRYARQPLLVSRSYCEHTLVELDQFFHRYFHIIPLSHLILLLIAHLCGAIVLPKCCASLCSCKAILPSTKWTLLLNRRLQWPLLRRTSGRFGLVYVAPAVCLPLILIHIHYV